MSDTKLANIVKRHVTSGASTADLARKPVPLGVAEVIDGTLWATNRYWITPAARVAPLLEQYNLAADRPGAFEVNSTVRKVGDRDPGVADIISAPGKYPEPAAPVRLGAHDAHVRTSDRGPWLAVYRTADGTLMGLPAGTLAWLSDVTSWQCDMRPAFGLGSGEHFGPARVMSQRPGGHPGLPVLIVADVIRTVKKACYGEDGQGEYEPAVTEDLGARVIGALMAVKLGDSS